MASSVYNNSNNQIPIAVGTPIDPDVAYYPNGQSHLSYAPPLESSTSAYSSTSSLRVQLNKSASQKKIEQTTLDTLRSQGYSRGLVSTLLNNKTAFPLRIWVVDNSGSMRTTDGNKIHMDQKTLAVKMISGCSRWSEMQQTVEYHARMAAITESPTIFRLLNDPGIIVGPQQFSIAEHGTESIDIELATALQTISNASPNGVTPLTSHIRTIRQSIVELEPQLRQDGTKVAVIIATDGLPSDEQGYTNEYVKNEFENALRSLMGLPIWIVVRLCTDEDDVVQYWNNIDSKLELNIEVLDDFASEAKEIYQHNKWLNYGLPLHRIREMGYYNNIMDLLDEKKLSKDELKQFLKLLLGHHMDEAPDPDIDWNGYCTAIEKAMQHEPKQWNPIRKRMEAWIDIHALKREYNNGGGFFASIFGF